MKLFKILFVVVTLVMIFLFLVVIIQPEVVTVYVPYDMAFGGSFVSVCLFSIMCLIIISK